TPGDAAPAGPHTITTARVAPHVHEETGGERAASRLDAAETDHEDVHDASEMFQAQIAQGPRVDAHATG
ncbi:hypothetical protein ACFXJJ_23025, partial [Streptomyces sp. NPDC059233]